MAIRTRIACVAAVAFGVMAVIVPTADDAARAVPPCGIPPAGAVLNASGALCELDFAGTGTFSWSLPAGVTDFSAIIVGGGGGARGASEDRSGFAGSGGSVLYATFTGLSSDSVATIVVGAGGASDGTTPEAGQPSSVTAGIHRSAPGGAAGSSAVQSCPMGDHGEFVVGNGAGAGGPAWISGPDCLAGPGLIPSLDDDSDGNPPLPIFSDLTDEFGPGGVINTHALSAALSGGFGVGAGVLVDLEIHRVVNTDGAGGAGMVIVRFTPPTPEPVGPTLLAATGLDLGAISAIAAGAAVLGVVAVLVSRRRAGWSRPPRSTGA